MRMMRIVNPILHRFQKINKMLLTGKCGTHMHPSHSKNSHMLPFLFYYLGGLGGFGGHEETTELFYGEALVVNY